MQLIFGMRKLLLNRKFLHYSKTYNWQWNYRVHIAIIVNNKIESLNSSRIHFFDCVQLARSDMSNRLDAFYSVLDRSRKSRANAYDVEVLDYEVPVQNYEAPVQDYEAPVQDDDAEVQDYDAEVQDYDVEVPDYEVPVASCDLLQNVMESARGPLKRNKPDISSLTNLEYSGREIVDSTAASGETYSQLDHGIVKSLQARNELTQGHAAEVTKSSQNKIIYICFMGCFVILAVGLVSAVAALVGAFAWIRKLDFELNEIMEAEQLLLEQKEKNVSLVIMEVSSHSEFQERISNDFTDFKASIEGIIESLNKTLVNWESQIGNLTWTLQQVQNTQRLMNTKVQNVNVSFTALRNDLSRSVYSNLMTTREALLNHITNSQAKSQGEVRRLTSKLVQFLQVHHVFDSCASVSSSSLPFPSGQYNMHNLDGTYDQAYCNMTLTCGSLTGGWRRVAYLNLSDQENNGCPSGFEYHNSMSCRRSSSSVGCSPVTYETNGISYSQVCGTVIAQGINTPDGFRNRKIGQNYVDGISLTYGSPRNHLWSYPVLHNGNCNDCTNEKPNFVFSNYFCFSPDCSSGMVCSESGCSENWFYRHIEDYITHSNIELRVCRSQSRDDEDIHLIHIEMYVQ